MNVKTNDIATLANVAAILVQSARLVGSDYDAPLYEDLSNAARAAAASVLRLLEAL